VPGAGADIKPALSVAAVALPVVGLMVMLRRFGFTKNTPLGVLNSPMFFLNSAKVIPVSWAPLLAEELLNVVRPEPTYHGTPVAHVTIAPILKPPTILSTRSLEPPKKVLPFPKGRS
jgi:hypothetical protein